METPPVEGTRFENPLADGIPPVPAAADPAHAAPSTDAAEDAGLSSLISKLLIVQLNCLGFPVDHTATPCVHCCSLRKKYREPCRGLPGRCKASKCVCCSTIWNTAICCQQTAFTIFIVVALAGVGISGVTGRDQDYEQRYDILSDPCFRHSSCDVCEASTSPSSQDGIACSCVWRSADVHASAEGFSFDGAYCTSSNMCETNRDESASSLGCFSLEVSYGGEDAATKSCEHSGWQGQLSIVGEQAAFYINAPDVTARQVGLSHEATLVAVPCSKVYPQIFLPLGTHSWSYSLAKDDSWNIGRWGAVVRLFNNRGDMLFGCDTTDEAGGRLDWENPLTCRNESVAIEQSGQFTVTADDAECGMSRKHSSLHIPRWESDRQRFRRFRRRLADGR